MMHELINTLDDDGRPAAKEETFNLAAALTLTEEGLNQMKKRIASNYQANLREKARLKTFDPIHGKRQHQDFFCHKVSFVHFM